MAEEKYRKGYKNGEKAWLYRDKQAKKAIRKSRKKLERQEFEANKRGKYGASKKSAPVTVKRIDTGEVVEVVPQWKLLRRKPR